jgi:excisionase family DNA binding protein
MCQPINKAAERFALSADPLLSASDVANEWQISLRTVRRWIADGRLPVVRLGRSVRVRRSVMQRISKRGLG